MNINATIIGQGIAFIFFVIFCMKYVWPPIINIIEQRQKEIADSLAIAEHTKKEIMVVKNDIQQQLRQAQEKAKFIINQAEQQCIKMLNSTKDEAIKEKKRILDQAIIEINMERDFVKEQLIKQIGLLIINASEKIIEKSLDGATNKKIIDKLTAQL